MPGYEIPETPAPSVRPRRYPIALRAPVRLGHDHLPLLVRDDPFALAPLQGIRHLDHAHPSRIRGSSQHERLVAQADVYGARRLLPRLAVHVHGVPALDDDLDVPGLADPNGLVDPPVELTEVQGSVDHHHVDHAVLHRARAVSLAALPHPHAAREAIDVQQDDPLGLRRQLPAHAVRDQVHVLVHPRTAVLHEIASAEDAVQELVGERAEEQLWAHVPRAMEPERRLGVHADAQVVLEDQRLALTHRPAARAVAGSVRRRVVVRRPR